ncbi:MAG: RHS repeat domain-containing protein [Myxococcales bacterium]
MRTHLIGLWLLLSACGAGGNSYLVYVRNAQGSVVAAVDDRGAKVWETHDDAYGLRLSSSGTAIPREFLDQPLDEETGFYQFHYRTYDPATAQWLQPDPKLQSKPDACASQPQDCDPYAYAGDRPEEWIDPDGRWVQNNVSIHGELYTVMTVAVIGNGADAAQVRANLEEAITASNATPGNRKVLAFVATYENAADAPKSFTKVELAYGAAGPSSADRSNSTVTLRADAASERTKPAGQLGPMALHELLHEAGAKDEYTEGEVNGARMTTPRDGFESDIMGTLSGKDIGDRDVQQMTDAQTSGDNNQGLAAPDPSDWPVATDPTDTSAAPAEVDYE